MYVYDMSRLYLFICQWTFRLLPCLGYCGWCCSDHWLHAFFRALSFFGYMPRNRTTRSYGSSRFTFLRNLHTVLHSGCTNLHSHQECTSVPFTPHLCQNLLFVFILVIPSWQIKGDISLCFWFAFPWLLVMLSIFLLPVGPLHFLFGKVSV